MGNISINKQVVNGVYLASTGKVEVFLGKVKGKKFNRLHGHEDVDGYLYWNITERINSGEQVYKLAFAQDVSKSFNENDLVRVVKAPKNNLVQCIGQIGDVIPNGLEFISGNLEMVLKRVIM